MTDVMSDLQQKQANKILESMVAFIKQHGKEEVARIELDTKGEFIA